MNTEGQLQSTLDAAQIRRLVMLRWLSVGVMGLSVSLLPNWLGLSVQTGPPLAVALALVAANFFTLAALRLGYACRPRGVFLQLLIDLLGWGVFVYFTGGTANPLISLLLPFLAIGATVLPAWMAWVLAALGVLAYSLLWQFHHPIRLADPELAAFWHLFGMWITFAVSAVVMVGFMLRMSAALRERDRALSDAVAERVRDEQLVALGNLAAGAAHTLGTPLATIRLLADEMARTQTLPAEAREDAELISAQVEHCRRTLAMLTARAGNLRAEGGGQVKADAWIGCVIDAWQAQRPHQSVRVACDGSTHEIEMVADETLAQAIHTLINNAADASPDEIEVRMSGSGGQLIIEVCDRGPGVPEAIRRNPGVAPLMYAEGSDNGEARVGGMGGEPRPRVNKDEGAMREGVVSGSGMRGPERSGPGVNELGMSEAGINQAGRSGGLGIGLFLARAAINRAGGQLTLDRRDGGGTIARMSLPLERLQT